MKREQSTNGEMPRGLMKRTKIVGYTSPLVCPGDLHLTQIDLQMGGAPFDNRFQPWLGASYWGGRVEYAELFGQNVSENVGCTRLD